MEVTEYEANRRLGFRVTIPGTGLFQGTLVLTPMDESTTHLASSGTMALQGLWRFAEPLMAGEVRNGEAEELKKIRSLLEKQA